MDLKKQKPSKNFEDRTDDTDRQKFMTTLKASLDPVAAYRNVREALIRSGMIDAPARQMEYRMKFDPAIKPSLGAFVDRTGGHQDFITGKPPEIDDKTRTFMREMVIDMIRRKIRGEPPASIQKRGRITPEEDPILGPAYRNEDYKDYRK